MTGETTSEPTPAGAGLKSYQFRRDREESWRALEEMMRKAEKSGVKSMTSDELLRLPGLYRSAVSSLSVARTTSLDQNVVRYLESLAVRGYFHVYGPRGTLGRALADFFFYRFPASVRAARWHIAAAALTMALGVAAGYFITIGNMDWFYSFLPEGMSQGRTPTTSTAELKGILYDTSKNAADRLYLFATFLFTHNAGIGLMAFALGFALGVPVFLLMFYNGLTLGAFAALYDSRGLSVDLWAWLSVHGTTEIMAVVLCGGAGLVLGGGIAFPGKHGRLDNLARHGRQASQIAIGAVIMFLVAGLLEGIVRQAITDVTTRYLIGGTALVWWVAYFALCGRGRRLDNGE